MASVLLPGMPVACEVLLYGSLLSARACGAPPWSQMQCCPRSCACLAEARAVVAHAGWTASGIFSFDGDGLVTRSAAYARHASFLRELSSMSACTLCSHSSALSGPHPCTAPAPPSEPEARSGQHAAWPGQPSCYQAYTVPVHPSTSARSFRSDDYFRPGDQVEAGQPRRRWVVRYREHRHLP